jgi:hypothetical protein
MGLGEQRRAARRDSGPEDVPPEKHPADHQAND